ncbi:hypothetical protein H4R23_005254, partial [Coemansia sp. Cherry 401B]
KHTVVEMVTVVVDGNTQTSLDTKTYDDGATTPEEDSSAAPYTSTYIEDGSVVVVTGGNLRDISAAPRTPSSVLTAFGASLAMAAALAALV